MDAGCQQDARRRASFVVASSEADAGRAGAPSRLKPTAQAGEVSESVMTYLLVAVVTFLVAFVGWQALRFTVDTFAPLDSQAPIKLDGRA